MSVFGGLLGVAVGIVGSHFTIVGVTPVIAVYSIFLAFGAAALCGLFFGTYPAARAAAHAPDRRPPIRMTNPEPEREMPDRDDRLLDLDDDVDAYEDDWEPAPEERALPPRRRRRLVTPASAALAAVLIAALGFIGGVEVQKGQADSAGGARRRRRRGARRACGAGAGAAAGARRLRRAAAAPRATPTIGSVANKHGSTLYVKDSDGNTVRVKTTSHSKINRTASTSVGAHPSRRHGHRPGDEELERDDHRDADQRDVLVGGERPRRAVRRRRLPAAASAAGGAAVRVAAARAAAAAQDAPAQPSGG